MAAPEGRPDPERDRNADLDPDLDTVLASSWALLRRGVEDRRHPARTPVLATVDASGGPEMRVVVLRHCCPDTRMLDVHTDQRSEKVGHLLAEPRCALLIHAQDLKVQLRIRARATVHIADPLADAQWATTHPASRLLYGSPWAPGVPVDDPAAAAATLHDRTDAERHGHFALLRLQVDRIEWLRLAAGGHRRACYEWPAGAGTPQATWRMP
jgi:pyridoxine/pyridoxamine 5'-phosphate oxidase